MVNTVSTEPQNQKLVEIQNNVVLLHYQGKFNDIRKILKKYESQEKILQRKTMEHIQVDV